MKIAHEYRRAHRNILDLIQEGNIGLIQAVQKYDPYRGVKLSSYASWWIRAYILKFILNNWRLVKVGTTQAQRKLFFNLRKEREKLEKQGFEVEAKHLAAALDVTEQEVIEMERRLNASETSLDAPMRSDEQGDRTAGRLRARGAGAAPRRAGRGGRVRRDPAATSCTRSATTLRDRDLEIFRDRLLNDEPATLVQIAERFGVTRERVRQIEERLKKRLRQYLEGRARRRVQIDDIDRLNGRGRRGERRRRAITVTQPPAVFVDGEHHACSWSCSTACDRRSCPCPVLQSGVLVASS